MNELISKIDNAIEKEAIKTGNMGTESISITLRLTEEEKAEFLKFNKYDDEHYWWEFDNNVSNKNVLNISYKENIR